MKLLVIFTIIAFSSVFSSNNTCPSGCRCGTYKNLNTVNCSFEWLVTVVMELPKETQVMDLSHNNIMEIGDSAFCFTDTLALESLNVSYNKIGHIHMNGFNCLSSLKILDLSHNIIQYLLPNWFWNMLALEELHLQHNDLYSFRASGPFFESNTLQFLDISYCKLSFINKDAFKQIYNLKVLDISGNFLYQLNGGVIEPLQKLEVLRAANNTWTCNSVMRKLARYCTKRSIHCSGICEQKLNGQKFEKIISKVIVNVNDNSTFNGFNKTVQQKENCTVIVNTESSWRIVLQPFYLLTVLISFVIGIVMGLIFGCWINSGSSNYRRSRIKKPDRSLIANCDSLGMSTPVLHRRFEVNP